jgi:hypothetical protein
MCTVGNLLKLFGPKVCQMFKMTKSRKHVYKYNIHVIICLKTFFVCTYVKYECRILRMDANARFFASTLQTK